MVIEQWERLTKLLNSSGRNLTTVQVIKAYKTEYTGELHREYREELEELVEKCDVEGLAKCMEYIQWSMYAE